MRQQPRSLLQQASGNGARIADSTCDRRRSSVAQAVGHVEKHFGPDRRVACAVGVGQSRRERGNGQVLGERW